MWPDDVANDDPTQPPGTDLKVLKEIMASAYNASRGQAMIHISGFTPWAFKYVKVPVVARHWLKLSDNNQHHPIVSAQCALSVTSYH